MSPAKDFTGICPTASEFMVEKSKSLIHWVVLSAATHWAPESASRELRSHGFILSRALTLLTVQLSVPLPLGGGRVTAWNYCHARSSLLTCHRTMSVVVSADNQQCQRTLLCPFRELGWRGRTRTCITSDASKTESNRVPYALTRQCEGKDAPLWAEVLCASALSVYDMLMTISGLWST